MYRYCKFCHGRGCLACPGEEKKDAAKRAANRKETLQLPEPLLSINPENPDEMDLLASVFHREKLEFAFEPDVDPDETARTGRGGGMQTIEREAALARVLQQAIRITNERKTNEDGE